MRALRGEEPPDARAAFPLKATLHAKTVETVPAEQATRSHHGGSVRVHKATYSANSPSEDRSTLALGDDFIFAGVWDGARSLPRPRLRPAAPPLTRVALARAGHGGTPCSEFVEGAAFGKPPALPSVLRSGLLSVGGGGLCCAQRRSLRASRRAAATPRRGPTATRASTAAS